MFAAFTFIGGGLSLHKLKKYADEDGKITLASVGKCILNESVSGLAAAVMPFANDINDLKNGYDAEIPIMKTFSDVVSCIGEIKKISGEHSGVKRYMPADEKLKEWGKALYTASGLVGDITGVPVRNLTNIVRGTMLYAKDVQNGNGLTTNQSITDYGKTEAPKKVYSYHDLTAAILSENTKKEKIIKDYLIDYDKEYGDYTDKKKPKKDIDHIDKGSMTKDLKQNILWLHEQGEDEKIEKLIEKLHEEYGYKPKTIRGWIKEADKKKREEEKN